MKEPGEAAIVDLLHSLTRLKERLTAQGRHIDVRTIDRTLAEI